MLLPVLFILKALSITCISDTMTIWKKVFTLAQINQFNQGSAVSYLDIEITEMGDDYLVATLPVTQNTKQPFGVLHGGIAITLAETVASIAGFLCVEKGKAVVGSEVSSSHLRPVCEGIITAKATPIKLGKTQQVWQINIQDEQQTLINVTRLTLSVISL